MTKYHLGTKTLLTLCALACCSEVSILCGPWPTRSRAQPHMQLLPGHGGGRLSGCLVGHLRIPVLSFEVRQYWRIPRACAYFGTGGSRVNGTTIHSLICTRQLEIQQEAVCLKARAFLFFNLLPRSPPLSHRHTLPASQWDEAMGRGPEWYQETLGDGRPVIIYLHGNLGTRWDENGSIGTLEGILMGLVGVT